MLPHITEKNILKKNPIWHAATLYLMRVTLPFVVYSA